MKKLLLILSAVFVSTLTYSGVDDWNHPNPYAYDLKSEIIDNGTTLKLTYSLNATAVHDQEKVYNDEIGLQIYLIDKNGERIKNADGTVWVNTAGAYTKGTHSVTIPVADLPPAAKEWLTSWEVVVHGNENWTKPKLVYNNIKTDNPLYYPRAAHGIAVAKHPSNKYFGKVFTAEASTSTIDGKSVPNSVWEYDGQLKYQTYHHKDYLNDEASYFSATTNYEPHRIKISDDGRLFATCYHTTASDAILEYEGNGKWRTIVSCGEGWYKYYRPGTTTKENIEKLYRRIIGMDVKGSGSDLKIIAAWVTPRGSTPTGSLDVSNYMAKVEVREYPIGASGGNLTPESGTVVAVFNDVNTVSGAKGLLYQGFLGDGENIAAQWNSATHGFVDVAYGEGTGNPIWMKVDFGANSIRPARIMLFKEGSSDAKYTYIMNSSTAVGGSNGDGGNANDGSGQYGYFGGSGIYIKGDTLFTASGGHKLFMYKISNDQLTNKTILVSSKQGLGTGGWVNAFAEDYAGNIYAISEDCDNIVVLATPYSGTRKTRASASQSFTISDPVPNIYATNLRYEAVEGAPKYKFSFNVNTQPKYAEIRFYKSYESMKKSMSAVNADDFKGDETDRDNNLYCYYPINTGLKQGKIEVEFGMVGGIIENKLLTNACLPRGELYWSVYVETDKSSVFAPIYRQGTTGKDAHYRLHATVNNYPETDQFGAIYAAQEDKRTGQNYSSLMVYEVDDMNSDDCSLNNTTRYQKSHEYRYATGSNPDKAAPRRMTVAPDGLVYIAHQGDSLTTASTVVANWKFGGIYTWNPNDAVDANGKIKLSLFSNNEIGTSTAVVLYPLVNGNDTTWKLYATNTYNEFGTHGQSYDTVAAADINKFGWNGFVEYVKNKNLNWTAWNNINTPTNKYKLGRGDESGNVSLAATDYGMWLCQYREHNVEVKKNIKEPYADNKGAYVLSFVPYGQYSNSSYAYGPRTWRSCTTDGGRVVTSSGVTTKNEAISNNSQTETAPLQSTPGGGMTYKKVKISDTQFNEYLYVVNHDGDIVQWKIAWADNNTPRMYINNESLKILKTPTETKGVLRVVPTKVGGVTTDWTTAAITSMCFDFAGNLVTTTGVSYFDMNQLQNEASELAPEGGQNIIIYTMPYDRTNAREIQAPKSNIFIPERLAQLNMTDDDIQKILTEHMDHGSQCYIDLYRPMQGGMFNTFCVPFELNTTSIPTDHPLYGAEIRRFTGVTLSESGGEKILTLNFENLINNTMAANVPHIINPKSNIKSIIPFDWLQVLAKNTTVVSPYFNFDNGNTITYQGILPKTQVDALYDQTTNLPLRLILVADNRLAVLTGNGEMYGFRGYFDLAQPLPPGTVAKISAKKDSPTNTTIVVDGKKINIEKYLREGRVYIRVGDSLYTVDGQVVE